VQHLADEDVKMKVLTYQHSRFLAESPLCMPTRRVIRGHWILPLMFFRLKLFGYRRTYYCYMVKVVECKYDDAPAQSRQT